MIVLVNSNTGEPIQIGDPVITLRGREGRLTGIRLPRRSHAEGRVTVAFDTGRTSDFSPGVIGAEWAAIENPKGEL
jgi:hypothetical protein